MSWADVNLLKLMDNGCSMGIANSKKRDTVRGVNNSSSLQAKILMALMKLFVERVLKSFYLV